MKKLFAIIVSILFLSVTATDAFGRGGGSFGGGRSSFSSGRSSGSSSRSSGSSSRGGGFGNSSSSKGSSSGSSRGGFFGNSSKSSGKGFFGNSSSPKKGGFGNGNVGTREKPVYTARSVLYERHIDVYHYYYPGYFYGSGYGWYHYYFWYHFFGNHAYCHHYGGGQATPRMCKYDGECTSAEVCNLKTNTCALKEGTW